MLGDAKPHFAHGMVIMVPDTFLVMPQLILQTDHSIRLHKWTETTDLRQITDQNISHDKINIDVLNSPL